MKKRRLKALIAVVTALLMLPVSTLAAQLSVTFFPAAMAAAGEANITLSVTNDSVYAMENIVITSAYQISIDASGVVINPGESKSFEQLVNVSESAIGTPITFDVTWTENGEARTGSATGMIERQNTSAITATRSVSAKQAAPKEKVTLTYSITNSGMITLKKVSLIDPEITDSNTPMFKDVTLEPGQSHEFIYEYTMGYETVTSAPVITYTPDGESDPKTYTGISAQTLGMVNSKLSIEVEQGVNSTDGTAFTLHITNNGNQKVTNIQITDELGEAINAEKFSLAVGESKVLNYRVKTDTERYVVFGVTGSSAGDTYEDKTASYVVRKYIDPSLIGLEFSASVLETLTAGGSIKVKFSVNNTGTMEMRDLVLIEPVAGELYRRDVIPTGLTEIEQTVYVGEPRDMVFTMTITDPAGNPYTYTANITAGVLGTDFAGEVQKTPEPEQIDVGIGADIGKSVSDALQVALIILIILTVVALAALITLSVLERKYKQKMAKKKAMRERQLRRAQAEAGSKKPTPPTDFDGGTTRVGPRR